MKGFLKIRYFKNTKGLCSDDFKKEDKIIYLNQNAISEVTEVEKFTHPFTRDYVDDFFTITMINNNIYYCKGKTFKTFIEKYDEEV
jgi:hypothetical protein